MNLHELTIKIQNELDEDLSRYDDEFDVWREVVLDCPSSTLESLLGQVQDLLSEDEFNIYMSDEVDSYINSLG